MELFQMIVYSIHLTVGTDEINTEAFTISTSYNESSSSSTIKYETRYYYIREK